MKLIKVEIAVQACFIAMEKNSEELHVSRNFLALLKQWHEINQRWYPCSGLH